MTDRDFEQLSERVTEKPAGALHRMTRPIASIIERFQQGYRMGLERNKERERLREIERKKEVVQTARFAAAAFSALAAGISVFIQETQELD